MPRQSVPHSPHDVNLGKELVKVKYDRIRIVSEDFTDFDGRTVPALVQLLARQGADRLRADLAAAGMPELRPVHALLLVPLLGGGRHASGLAAHLGVSRQAVAQVVATLERDRYVRRVTDPGDARAKLVCLTPRGRAALRTMRAVARATEEGWRQQLGDNRLAEFRAILLDLLTATT
jgi:DNA-binding MarR family transcriptional regulator